MKRIGYAFSHTKMIIFELGCDAGHRFEGWFGSGDDFQRQRTAGQLNCPVCGSAAIERIPTARVHVPRDSSPAVDESPKPAAPAADKPRELSVAAFIDHVISNSEDVGARFADEARKIHEGEAPKRTIRGTATAEETRALLEDDIAVLPLPVPPKESWH